jgi:hypothetical protein
MKFLPPLIMLWEIPYGFLETLKRHIKTYARLCIEVNFSNWVLEEIWIKVLEYNGCARFTIDNISIVTQP